VGRPSRVILETQDELDGVEATALKITHFDGKKL
jgi:hypothetical protein